MKKLLAPISIAVALASSFAACTRGEDASTQREIPLVEFLGQRGFTIIPIKLEDELHYANNFLTIGPRHIMAVAGQSKELQEALAEHHVKVEWIPLETLIKGYGAAHCMTQVISAQLAK